MEEFRPLPTPVELTAALPASPAQLAFVHQTRQAIRRILRKEDRRLLVIVGPCSIHDVAAARDYAARLAPLAHALGDRMLIVARTYFEKPRTNGGWKGLLTDPHLDGSGDVAHGLTLARTLLRDLIDLRLPTATEFLDPAAPQYLADLISWSAIGARTAESQTHRQLASGLSMPVGFKNTTGGQVRPAIQAIKAAAHAHTTLGMTPAGLPAAIRTRGNPDCHLVLRGGAGGPNYDARHIAVAEQALQEANLPGALVVDCSHDNSRREPLRQLDVVGEVLGQIEAGNESIVGLMLESNLSAGCQSLAVGRQQLRYGVSITDGCLDWHSTERCLQQVHAALDSRSVTRPAADRVLPADAVA